MKKINIQPWYDKTNRYSSISRNLQIILLLLQLILLLMYIIVSFKAMPYSDFTFSMFLLVGGICIISSILILYVVDHIDNIFINIFDLQTFDQYLSQQLSVDKVSINGYGQNSAFHNFPPSEGCYDISCRYGDERKDYNMTINLVTKTIKLQEKEKISLSKSIQYDSTGYLLLQKKLSFIDERIKAGDKIHELSDTQWGIYRDEIRTLLQRDLTEKQQRAIEELLSKISDNIFSPDSEKQRMDTDVTIEVLDQLLNINSYKSMQKKVLYDNCYGELDIL